MIRVILALLFAVLFLICMIPMQFVEFLIGKYKGQKAKDALARTLIRFAFRVILLISGVKIDCRGQENIPTDEAVLYVSNHRSYFDIIITYTLLPGPTGYVAKMEMQKIPLLSSWMKLIRCLFLDRKDPRQGLKMILAGIEQIREGVSVFICPEGTRVDGEEKEMLPFKEGSLKIAEKTNCPVVPVAIHNTRNILEAHFPFIRATHVVVQFGTPFRPGDLSKEERKFCGAYTQKRILEMLEQMDA